MTPETQNRFPAFDGYTFLSEGGRALYGHIGYAIMHSYAVTVPEWPMPIKGAIESKDHAAKWYFVVTNESQFVPYLEECAADPSVLTRMEEGIIAEREAVIKAISPHNLSELDDAGLQDLFRTYYTRLENLVRIAGRVRYLDRAIIYKFREAFVNADDYLRIISVSDTLTFVSKEQLAIWGVSQRMQESGKTIEDAEIREDLKRVHDEFMWCSMGYYIERPKDIEDYQRAVEENKESAAVQIEQLQNKHKIDLEIREKTLESLTGDQKAWAHVAATSTYLKDLYKYSVSKSIYYADQLFSELGKRTGKEVAFLKDLIPAETERLITAKSCDEDFALEYAQRYAIYSHGDEFRVMVGREAIEFSNAFLSIKDSTATSFKGRVASKGKGVGAAKVIINTSDFAKFKKGDVLVAINTSPDFVPLMKMAAAIVAEEGGLTSHTSVVSRELGVPCVVGVAGICSIVKDNDMIEVDAESGVVKLIS